eukprot:5776351-Karenia_brevis.AAC.1
MAAYSACLINRSRKGPDGRTAREFRKGRAWRQPLIPFSECVMYLVAGRRESRLDSGYKGRGIYWGIKEGTNLHYVGTKEC